MFSQVSGTSVLLSPKSHIYRKLSEKSQFPSCNYDLEVDTNAIYKSETHNYGNSDTTEHSISTKTGKKTVHR